MSNAETSLSARPLTIDFPPSVGSVQFSIQPPLPEGAALYLVGYNAVTVALSNSDPAYANAPTTADVITVSSATPSLPFLPVQYAVPAYNASTGAAINNPATGAAYTATQNLGQDPQNNPGVTVYTTGSPAPSGVKNGINIYPAWSGPLPYPKLVCDKIPAMIDNVKLNVTDLFGRPITFVRLTLEFVTLAHPRPFLSLTEPKWRRDASKATYQG